MILSSNKITVSSSDAKELYHEGAAERETVILFNDKITVEIYYFDSNTILRITIYIPHDIHKNIVCLCRIYFQRAAILFGAMTSLTVTYASLTVTYKLSISSFASA